ncbi:L-Aspartase-like protein [Trichoderma ceciliae]
MASDSKPSGAMLWGGRFTDWEAGTFAIVPGVDEDIFTANERRLGEIIGMNIADKLHTGRSRNEQVVCDMRMWLRDELRKIEEHLISFLNVIASPHPWSHWMPSHGFAFASDLERLREVIKRVNRNPLDCGALAGNPFGIDRDMITKELGFDGLIWNSMASVSDRDFHISRRAEDLIIYSTAEVGFVRLSDAYSTESSLMPQTPTVLSYCEARVVVPCLPSTYNKDLQESIEPMLDHVKTVSDSIQIANGVLATLNVDAAKMNAALDPFMLATNVADYLVRKGVPFRETHHISGRCVAKSKETGIPMSELSFEQLKAIDSRFEEDIAEAFVYETSVERRSAKGGTSKSSVLEQIQVIKAALGGSQI